MGVIEQKQFAAKAMGTKPSLSELYAALAGISAAGVTFMRAGVKQHSLVSLAFSAAVLSFDTKEALNFGRKTPENIASKIIDFLEKAAIELDRYPDVRLSWPSNQRGGVSGDVKKHIDSILSREQDFSKRAPSQIIDLQGPVTEDMPYLPAYKK